MLYPLLGREEGVHTHTYALISFLSSLLFSDLRAELNTKMENTVAVGAEPNQRSVTLRPACKIITCGIYMKNTKSNRLLLYILFFPLPAEQLLKSSHALEIQKLKDDLQVCHLM